MQYGRYKGIKYSEIGSRVLPEVELGLQKMSGPI